MTIAIMVAVMLTRQFPDAYPLYQRRVKAIIPFLS